MATETLLTVEEYAALQEPEGVRYELSGGEQCRHRPRL
jgi:hypothetical protein